MMLRSLELRCFGCFGERSFEFRRGLNLVTGPNESGKSTLLEAIPAVLFGVRNKERFRPWGRPDQCAAALVMEIDDRTLRVERDILSDQVVLTELDGFHQPLYRFEGPAPPGGCSSEQAEYLEKVAGLFGLTREEEFRATLFFGQGSPTLSEGMGRSIKALLFGAGQGKPELVLRSLEKDLLSLTSENPWGENHPKDQELELLRKKLTDLEERWRAGRKDAEELEGLQQRIRELKESIEQDRVEFDKGERYLSWVRRRWQEESEGESPRSEPTEKEPPASGKARELEARRQKLSGEILKTGLPREIPEDLPLILSEAEKVRKDLVGLQAESAELRKQLLALASPPVRPALGLSGLFLASGAGLAWLRPQWMSYALMSAALLIAPVWLVYLWRAGLRRAERGQLKGQAQVLENRREKAQGQLAELDERFERIGMSPSAVEIVKMQKHLDRHRQLSQQLLEVEGALSVLETLQQGEEGEKEEKGQESNPQPDRRPPPELTPEELPEAEAKLKALGDGIREREKKLLDWVRREGELKARVEEIKRIEEEGEAIREQEKTLEHRKKILALGHELLSGAMEDFRVNHLEKVAGEVGRHIAHVTGGRHSEVQFDEALNCFLQDRDGDWQPLESFSRGTEDAVGMAVRLALTESLFPGTRLPLFLDDPLVNMDRSRLAESLRMLERIGGDHQVIFLSHDERLRKRAARDRWHVISLEEGGTSEKNQPQERNEDGGQLYLL
jgi:DNA repair exonuclease SbcCD ATPase subunit